MNASAPPRQFHRVGQRRPMLRALVERLRAAEARYRMRAYLDAMDDRTLRDIGITRGDIEGIKLGRVPW